ncbi:MAG: hypothetical protein ACLT4A_00210 [Anaerobutyricum soehngenii]
MDKNLKKNMKVLFNLIVDEAEKNEEFAEALSKIFCKETPGKKIKNNTGEKRASNRRDKAILDPIKLAEDGELSADVLLPLSEKELKDIVAEYGMDSSKLAMKWKAKDRLIQLILDTSFRRASKGDAFRN